MISPHHPEAVAVIGMAGRFPHAATLREFWQNLRARGMTESGGQPAAMGLRSRWLRSFPEAAAPLVPIVPARVS